MMVLLSLIVGIIGVVLASAIVHALVYDAMRRNRL